MELHSATFSVLHASKNFFSHGAIKCILDLLQSNIFWTLFNQIYSGFSAIKYILDFVQSNMFWTDHEMMLLLDVDS